MCGCHMPKQCSIVMACNLELHATILWRVGSYIVYMDVLESRHLGRTFKLMKPKHEDRVSVCNESLSLNLLVAGLKYVNSVSVYF